MYIYQQEPKPLQSKAVQERHENCVGQYGLEDLSIECIAGPIDLLFYISDENITSAILANYALVKCVLCHLAGPRIMSIALV